MDNVTISSKAKSYLTSYLLSIYEGHYWSQKGIWLGPSLFALILYLKQSILSTSLKFLFESSLFLIKWYIWWLMMPIWFHKYNIEASFVNLGLIVVKFKLFLSSWNICVNKNKLQQGNLETLVMQLGMDCLDLE